MTKKQVDANERYISMFHKYCEDMQATTKQTITDKYRWILTPSMDRKFNEFLGLYESVYAKSKCGCNRPLIIHGDPGVGKSLFTDVFEALYRKQNPDINKDQVKKLNIAALNPNLVESELFGHIKGAFTGAIQKKEGFFQNTRLLILEEVGELPKHVQAKLLTVLEDGFFFPVGETKKKMHVGNLQVIATTNVPLTKDYFRQDFLGRCYTFRIPPIHERREDILYLFAHEYPALLRSLSAANLTVLLAYNWPDNMRELEKYGMTRDIWSHSNEDLSLLIKASMILKDDIGVDLIFFEKLLSKKGLTLGPHVTERHDRSQVFDYKKEALTYWFDEELDPAFGNIRPVASQMKDDFKDIFWMEIVPEFESTMDYFRLLAFLLNANPKGNANLLDIDAVLSNGQNASLADIHIVIKKILANKKIYGYAKKRWDSILSSAPSVADPFIINLHDHERDYLQKVLERAGGNKSEAGRLSGVSRETFTSRLKKYGLL